MQNSSEIEYSKIDYNHPTYRMSRILPQVGSTNQLINPGGGDETIFEIPVKTFNLARSVLEFTISPAVTGAQLCAYKDCLTPIRQIQFVTRTGIYMCDIDNVPNYTKIVWKAETPLQEYLTYDKFRSGTATVTSVGAGRYLRSINAIAATDQRYQDNTFVDVSYLEPQYLEVGTNTTRTPCYFIELPLGAIYNTIFSVDKDLYLGEIVLLRIVWNATNRIFFNKVNATKPAAANATNVTAFTGQVQLNDLMLYLAVEKNIEIENQLKSVVASSGFNVLIPYVYQAKNNIGPAPSHTISLRYNRGHGRRLVKIYHSTFNNNETVSIGAVATGGSQRVIATGYDNDNRAVIYLGWDGTDNTNAVPRNRSKVQVFYTMLDNERLQEFNLVCADYDDYMILKDKLKGSIIQSADMFYYNWFYVDDFSGLEDLTKKPYNSENLEVGLDLSIERKWDFYAQQVNTIAAADADTAANSVDAANANGGQYNHYTFAITQKMLTVSPAGITVV